MLKINRIIKCNGRIVIEVTRYYNYTDEELEQITEDELKARFERDIKQIYNWVDTCDDIKITIER